MSLRVHPKLPPAGSLIFAPMEGITDHLFRQVILALYPEWDRVCTDFLRVPSESIYPVKRMREHLGEEFIHNPEALNKHVFQILTCARGRLGPFLDNLKELNIPHLDLNIGCPSRTVTSHGGGSMLLARPQELEFVVKTIRRHFPGLFTTKIRVGFNDDNDFSDNIKLLIDCGVDAITIHGRTKVQLYNGIANWKYFAKAVALSDIPIFGNGDIWTGQDIKNVFDETGCWGLMCGRSALKTPWLARNWKNFQTNLTDEEALAIRTQEIPKYFSHLLTSYSAHMPATSALKRLKSLVRFIFDDYPQGASIKSQFLRAQELPLHLLDPSLYKNPEILTDLQ